MHNEQAVEAKKKYRERCKASLFFFAQACLGMDRLQPRLHLPFANFIQYYPWNGGPPASRRKLAVMSRAHFKSSICSVALPLWLLIHDRNTTVLLLSAKIDNPVKWLTQIKTIVRYNSLFRWAFPEIRPGGKWDEEEMTLTRDPSFMGQAQASITAGSVRGGQASQHFHHCIGDDLVNEQTARSESEMNAAIKLYDHIESLLQEWAASTFTLVGTPWGREDVIEHAMSTEVRAGQRLYWKIGARGGFEISDELSDHTEFIPLRDPHDYPGTNPHDPAINEIGPWEPGKPILPEECPEEKLQNEERKNPEAYSLQYLCEPYREGQNGFQLDLIHDFALYQDGRLECGCHADSNILEGVTIFVTDPAFSENKRACESAVVVLHKAKNGCMYILEEWGDRVDPDTYVNKMCEIANRWYKLGNLKRGGIEAVQFQVTFRYWLDTLKNDGKFPMGVELIGVKPERREKDVRISGLIPSINNGLWHKRPTMRRVAGKNSLMEQVFQWPYSRKRDRIDALAYCFDTWEGITSHGDQTSNSAVIWNREYERRRAREIAMEDE